MTSVYVVIGVVFAAAFAFANPGFRLWFTATRFRIKRSLGLGQGVIAPAAKTTQYQRPGDHAVADADAEAEAEAAWRKRRQQKAPKPGKAKASSGSKAGGGGRRAKKDQPLDPR
jgi:hypothetical protein